MKRIPAIMLLASLSISVCLFSQNKKVDKVDNVLQHTDNSINKVKNILAVFQPYLLKARQIYFEGKQLANDIKGSGQTIKQLNSNAQNVTYTTTSSTDTFSNQQTTFNNNTGSVYNSQSSTFSNTANTSNASYNNSPQNYLPNQSLPINNPATVNNDGSGNWGNQNNALYGNCLDMLSGTIMGLGEAESNPKSVDVIFIAANGSYQLWTPNYAHNEVAAEYTSRSTYESVVKWSDVNETEIATTRMTLSQFDQIQNNSQILNAVKNAQNYASSLTEFTKLDGKVYAVKAELEDRTVYGLIAIVKQVGTDGSNGYLKIKIKSQGVDKNQDGQIDASAYQR